MSDVHIETFAADLSAIITIHLKTIADKINKENQSTLTILQKIPFVKELIHKLETAERKVKQLTDILENYKKVARVNLEISEMSNVEKTASTADEIQAFMKTRVEQGNNRYLSDEEDEESD